MKSNIISKNRDIETDRERQKDDNNISDHIKQFNG